jgi:hypothetical protein
LQNEHSEKIASIGNGNCHTNQQNSSLSDGFRSLMIKLMMLDLDDKHEMRRKRFQELVLVNMM